MSSPPSFCACCHHLIIPQSCLSASVSFSQPPSLILVHVSRPHQPLALLSFLLSCLFSRSCLLVSSFVVISSPSPPSFAIQSPSPPTPPPDSLLFAIVPYHSLLPPTGALQVMGLFPITAQLVLLDTLPSPLPRLAPPHWGQGPKYPVGTC